MSNKPKLKRQAPKQAKKPFPIVPVAVAFALVLVIGFVAAVAGGSSGSDDDRPAFGPVFVDGDELAAFSGPAGDPAVGAAAPRIEGIDFDEDPVSVGGGAGEPTMVVFLAHWCPHCQAEVPVIVDLEADGELEGVRLVGVATGTNPDAPNFPPARWLDREGWPGDVLLDDDEHTAAKAYGLAGYPFIVTLDAEGTVVSRTSGEVPREALIAAADAARG